jgi:hypothetical protein
MGEAIGAGFSLIGRKPLAVLAWALAWAVLSGGMGLFLVSYVGADYVELFRHFGSFAATAQPGVFPPEMLRLQQKMSLVQPFQLLFSVVAWTMLVSAINRAVLEPANDAAAYLRLGVRELWLGLVMIVLVVLAWLGIFALVIAVVIGAGIPALVLSLLHQQAWIWLPGSVAVIVGVGAYVWVLMRLSLALPMTFVEEEFRLFESWNLTQGSSLKLFVMALLLTMIAMLLALLVDCVFVGAAFAAVGGSINDIGSLQKLADLPTQDLVRTARPWIVGWFASSSFFGVVTITILAAPWAVAYRQIAASAEPSPI